MLFSYAPHMNCEQINYANWKADAFSASQLAQQQKSRDRRNGIVHPQIERQSQQNGQKGTNYENGRIAMVIQLRKRFAKGYSRRPKRNFSLQQTFSKRISWKKNQQSISADNAFAV